MSENSDKLAVPGGNRRKYCLKIGMHITTCILDKTCKQCKEELNDQKQPNKPQNGSKTAPKTAKTIPGTVPDSDKKRPENSPNQGGNRDTTSGITSKTQESPVFSKLRTRAPRTKRAIEADNSSQTNLKIQ